MAAATAGVSHGTGTSRAATLLPLVIALALGMLVIAYRRFEMFIAKILHTLKAEGANSRRCNGDRSENGRRLDGG
jgi:hypothetical protein